MDWKIFVLLRTLNRCGGAAGLAHLDRHGVDTGTILTALKLRFIAKQGQFYGLTLDGTKTFEKWYSTYKKWGQA